MKTYPKVPPFDHPVTEPELFEADDLAIIEKFDGANGRVMLYEDRFRDEYSEAVLEVEPSDGDLVFGSKNVVRGTHTMERTSIDGVSADPAVDGAFDNFYEFLRNSIDIASFREIQSELGPIVVFAENMTRHTLNYHEAANGEIPSLIGFDVFVVRDGPDSVPPNPYDEDFEGFLALSEAWDVLEKIGVPSATVLDGPGPVSFDPDEFEIPFSSLAPLKAEGVVLRSDERAERAKFLSDEFKEKNKEVFGLRPEQADSGAEWVVAKYCTNARIRKIMNKMVVEEGREFGLHLNDDLYNRVFDDIWDEHYHEIKTLDFEFNPSEMKPLIAKRCIEQLRLIKDNAEINDRDPMDIWANYQ